MSYLTDWFKVGAQLSPPQDPRCTFNHDIWMVKKIDFENNIWEGVELISKREEIFFINDMIGWVPLILPEPKG